MKFFLALILGVVLVLAPGCNSVVQNPLKKDGGGSSGGGGGGGGESSGSSGSGATGASCGSPIEGITQTGGASQTTLSSLHPSAQSFTVTAQVRVPRITLTLKKSPAGTATMNFYVALYNGGAGTPNTANSVLTSVTKSITTNAITAGAFDFDFPTQPTLTAGNTYWIYALPSTPVFQIYSNASGYANGLGLYWDGGAPSAWSANPGGGDPLIGDFLFKVWVCD